jgi:ParB family chromosome partitioning protein
MNNSAETTNSGARKILVIPIHKIRAFEEQPRKFFDPVSLRGLADSIRELGQITPALVRPLVPHVKDFEYELVEGERRIRACLMAGVSSLRAEVDENIKSGDEQFVKSVAANFNRDGHPPIECAHAIERLKKMGQTDAQIGTIMGGKSTSWVQQHRSLLKLVPDVLAMLDPALPSEKQLSFCIAIQLVDKPPEYQVELARSIVEMNLGMREATHLIYKTIHAKGHSNTRGIYKQFNNLSNFIKRATKQLDLDLDVSDEHFLVLIKSKELQRRMQLLENVELLEKKVKALKEKTLKAIENC